MCKIMKVSGTRAGSQALLHMEALNYCDSESGPRQAASINRGCSSEGPVDEVTSDSGPLQTAAISRGCRFQGTAARGTRKSDMGPVLIVSSVVFFQGG